MKMTTQDIVIVPFTKKTEVDRAIFSEIFDRANLTKLVTVPSILKLEVATSDPSWVTS
jgi:hypothetical protein